MSKHAKNECTVQTFIYMLVYIDIMWRLSWRSGKNPLNEKKKNLASTSKNLSYLIILSRFLFFLVDQTRFFSSWTSGKNLFLSFRKEPCLNSKKSSISCNSFQILIFLIDQTRFFSPWTSGKNLFFFPAKRILSEGQD